MKVWTCTDILTYISSSCLGVMHVMSSAGHFNTTDPGRWFELNDYNTSNQVDIIDYEDSNGVPVLVR